MFAQHHFVALKLNAGCGGYLDKVHKILVEILDLKAGFLLASFSTKQLFSFENNIK